MLDYLIVGLGLAGISFCEVLKKHGRSFKVMADGSQTSSLIAGGLYNPVTLKRLTPVWKAGEQLNIAVPFYRDLEVRLGVKLDYKVPILRRFASIEEQNLWFEAMDRPLLRPFLSVNILRNKNPNIYAPFGYGEVLYTGRVATRTLLTAYSDYLIGEGALTMETFDFGSLTMVEGLLEYKSVRAKNIVFAEGYGLKNNPYFNYLPLNGTKGELLTIRAPRLREDKVIKSSVFLIPLGNDLYRIGSTYKWKDKSNLPTAEAKNELLNKLDTFLKCDYKVIDHVAGIRPTVVDRKPLVGTHPKYNGLHILNGLGSRGVLLAPWSANLLYDKIGNGRDIPKEMDISRFAAKYFDKDQGNGG